MGGAGHLNMDHGVPTVGRGTNFGGLRSLNTRPLGESAPSALTKEGLRGPRMDHGGEMGPAVRPRIGLGVVIIGNAIRSGIESEQPPSQRTGAEPLKGNKRAIAQKYEDQKSKSAKEITPTSHTEEIVFFGKPDRVTFDPDHRVGKLGGDNNYRDVVVSRDGFLFARHYFYMMSAGKVDRYWWDDPLASAGGDPGKRKEVPICEGEDDDDCDGGDVLPGTLPPNVFEIDDKPGGGNGKKADTTPKIAQGTPPTLVTGDPKDGIEVPGGKVHRGTMTIDFGGGDQRTAITCWVEVDKTAACKDFQWYQWDCAVVSVDWNDGKGLQKPKTQPDLAVEAKTGSYIHFGKWGPDDYRETKNKKLRKMFAGAKNNDCPEPKTPLQGGAYAGAQNIQIPGQPEVKPKTPEVMQRLIDAPDATAAVDPVLQKVAGRTKRAEDPPPDEKPITVEITLYFRAALYCDTNCLGTFEWKEVQKFKVTPRWKPRPDKGEETAGIQGKNAPKPQLLYDLTFVAEKVGKFTPEIGAWHAPPC
jgi:hypothetical protein